MIPAYKKKTTCMALAVSAAMLCLSASALAQHEHPAAKQPTPQESVKLTIPDVLLVNQDGRQVHFYSDLVKGKVVAINFLFTTCTTICPPLSATFAKVQSLMESRVGQEVHLISVSVDPVTDTPARMKAWLDRFQAKPGWTFVSGQKPEVDKLLKALGAFGSPKEDHTPMVLVGNDIKNSWTRAFGVGAATQLVQLLDGMLGGPVSASTGKEQRQQ